MSIVENLFIRTAIDDVNDIVNTMDSKDRKLLGLHGKEY